jgi:hypothetical protein
MESVLKRVRYAEKTSLPPPPVMVGCGVEVRVGGGVKVGDGSEVCEACTVEVSLGRGFCVVLGLHAQINSVHTNKNSTR